MTLDWALTLETLKFWSTYRKRSMMGGDSPIGYTHFWHYVVTMQPSLLLLALPFWVETLWCTHPKNKKQRPKVLVSLHSRVMWWSPAIFVVVVVGSAFQGRDIVMHPQENKKGTKSLVSLHSRLMWSPPF